MTSLKRLLLTDFRNYAEFAILPDRRLNVLTGANGSGKTNLLEAISLLVPGRGLRGAPADALARHGASGWAVACRLDRDGEIRELGTGTLGRLPGWSGRGRQFRLDGEPVRSHAEIASLLSVTWLTPQMERLFGEAASGRRRFLDRLVAGLDASHARALAAHEVAVANRNRLLLERRHETAWLRAAEDAIARHAAALTAARLALCRRIEQADPDPDGFPATSLTLLCPIAERLSSQPARLVEEWIRAMLAASRDADARAGSTGLGAHRCDVAIKERATGLPAHLASTGQQKALLVGLTLSHAALIEQDRGEAPVLLLDEALVHLDEQRRERLFSRLERLLCQVFLTGTDAAPFAPLARAASFWQAGGGTVLACKAPAP